MPSLFRFLVVAGIMGAVVFGGLYAMSVFFEPVPKETATPVPGVKVRARKSYAATKLPPQEAIWGFTK